MDIQQKGEGILAAYTHGFKKGNQEVQLHK